MNLEKMREDLLRRFATLEAHRRQIDDGQNQLAARAANQAASMPDAIQTAADSVDRDEAGILGHRRLRTLLTERARLERIGADHAERKAARG